MEPINSGCLCCVVLCTAISLRTYSLVKNEHASTSFAYFRIDIKTEGHAVTKCKASVSFLFPWIGKTTIHLSQILKCVCVCVCVLVLQNLRTARNSLTDHRPCAPQCSPRSITIKHAFGSTKLLVHFMFWFVLYEKLAVNCCLCIGY